MIWPCFGWGYLLTYSLFLVVAGVVGAFLFVGAIVSSSSPMPVRSAKDNSVADGSCVDFKLSALTALVSRVHRYALILSWFIPGSGAGFHFELSAPSFAFNVVSSVSSLSTAMVDCASSCVIV